MGKVNKLKMLEEFYINVMSGRLFNSIDQRCRNKNRKDYKNYGGKGIKNYLTKYAIIYLMKRDKSWLLKNPTIDRKNVKGHYIIQNCQFIEKQLIVKKINLNL